MLSGNRCVHPSFKLLMDAIYKYTFICNQLNFTDGKVSWLTNGAENQIIKVLPADINIYELNIKLFFSWTLYKSDT